MDTSDYSFGYIAGWSDGKKLTALKASLETIRATATELITEIDGHFATLQKGREQNTGRAMSEGVLTGWAFEGGKVEVNKPDSCLQVVFNSKPGEEVRAELKRGGFRWAPSVGAWQRQLNDSALHAVNTIKSIQPLTGEKPADLLQRAGVLDNSTMDRGQRPPDKKAIKRKRGYER